MPVKLPLSTIYVFALIGLPLLLPFVTMSYGNVSIETVKVAFFSLSIVSFVAGLFFSHRLRRQNSLPRSAFIPPLLFTLWIVWNGATSCIHNSFIGSFWGDPWYQFGLWTLLLLLIYLLLIITYMSQYYELIIVVGFGLYGIIQSMLIILMFPLTSPIRSTTTVGEPNWLGSTLMVSFLILLVTAQIKTYKKYQRFFSITLGIIFLGIISTGSRSSLLSIIITGAMMPLLLHKKLSLNQKTALLLCSIVICFISVIGIGLNATKLAQFFAHQPATTSFRGVNGTDSRLWIYQKGILLALEKPLTGWGWERIEYAYNQPIPDTRIGLQDLTIPRSHNMFLDLLISGGIPSMVLFSFFMFSVIRTGISHSQHHPLSVGFILAFTSLLIYAQFNPFSISHWVILFFLAGTILHRSSLHHSDATS